MKGKFTWCCRAGQGGARWICLLDNLCHQFHIEARGICDAHDYAITGDWIEKPTSRAHKLAKFYRLHPTETS